MAVCVEVSIVFLLGNLLWSPQIPGFASDFRASRIDGCRVLSRSCLGCICASTHSTTASVSVTSSLLALVTGSRDINSCGLKLLAFYPCQLITMDPFRALVGRRLIDRYRIAAVFVLGLMGAISLSPRVAIQGWACLGLGNVASSSSVDGVMKLCTRKIIVGVYFATNSVHTRVERVGVAILGSEMVLLGKVRVGHVVFIVLFLGHVVSP